MQKRIDDDDEEAREKAEAKKRIDD
jgi:hypothetical protein